MQPASPRQERVSAILVGVVGWNGLVTGSESVSYTHLRAHETVLDLVCRLLLEKKKSQEISASESYCVHSDTGSDRLIVCSNTSG